MGDLFPAALETSGETGGPGSCFFSWAANRLDEKAKLWADEIAALAKERCGGNRRIAIDRIDPAGAHHLEAAGITIHDGQEPCELARAIKSADEIACMNHAIAVCEAGMARMHEALRPGISENELFALL